MLTVIEIFCTWLNEIDKEVRDHVVFILSSPSTHQAISCDSDVLVDNFLCVELMLFVHYLVGMQHTVIEVHVQHHGMHTSCMLTHVHVHVCFSYFLLLALL